jgi:hypothetical protein
MDAQPWEHTRNHWTVHFKWWAAQDVNHTSVNVFKGNYSAVHMEGKNQEALWERQAQQRCALTVLALAYNTVLGKSWLQFSCSEKCLGKSKEV